MSFLAPRNGLWTSIFVRTTRNDAAIVAIVRARGRVFALDGFVCRTGPIPVCPEKDFSPIVALNPYQSHWTIKVKLAKMYKLRRFTSKKEPFEESSVCTAVLVDDQATEIEGTFWREAAEYYHEKLQEGKVRSVKWVDWESVT